MEIYGKIIICDRCGSKIFAEQKQAALPCFENEYPDADGWRSLENFDGAFLTLCPECAEGYEKAVMDFLGPEYARRKK